MGWGKIGWGKISGLFGLKALTLAFVLTPVTAVAPPLATPAVAQIGIFIPGVRFYGGGRYRGSGRHRGRGSGRRHRGGGGGGGSAASAPTPKGIRGNTD